MKPSLFVVLTVDTEAQLFPQHKEILSLPVSANQMLERAHSSLRTVDFCRVPGVCGDEMIVAV